MREDMQDQGYSKEDEYFHRKDQELIAKLREQADAQRAQMEEENKKKEYWMRCPKCGASMKEERYADAVMVDRCTSESCGGVFFDSGEVELMMKANSSLVQRIFGR